MPGLLVYRGRKRSKQPSEPKSKNYFPYALLAALAALLAIPTSLGMLSGGPSLVLVSQTETPIGALQPQSFSCVPGSVLSADFRGFAFDTNSTIDSFSIDRNAKLITVGVNGADGSAGTFCINVPKDFIPTKELKTTIDNIPWNADLHEFSNSNVVSLNYHHSERVIQISGGTVVPPPKPTPTNGTQTGASQQQQQQQVVVVVPGAQEPVPVPDEPKKRDTKEKDICPSTKLTPESIVATGIPVVFSSEEKPAFTVKPDASGTRVQTKTRALVNFMSDMGETVGVAFKLDNLSKEDILVRIKVTASDALFVDLVKSSGIDVVRPIKSDEYLVKMGGDASKAELITKVTAVSPGFHVFFIEILPLFDQPPCP